MGGKTPNVAGGCRKAPKALWMVGLLLLAIVVARSASFGALRRLRAPDIHSEYVKYLSAKDTVTAYIAYPGRPQPAPGVVVIHEIFGMSDFSRQTTEQLAKDGFVAIAPDLLSRRGGTPPSTDDARKLIAGLDPDTVTKDLDATVAYVKRIKAARGDRVGVIGFCWGGGQSFRYATNNPSLGAFVVCYGQGPTPWPSRASVRRGSASTPRTTPASTPAWATWTRRSGRTTRPTATPYIP